MNETLKSIIKFLEMNGMGQSARQIKEEMVMIRHDINDPTNNLLAIIANVMNDKKLNDKKNKHEQQPDRNFNKRKPKVYSQEETEKIMEKLMNKLVQTPNLLEDEKLNAKIEKFFDNQTFQKMVEQADVFHDISNLSIQNSLLKNVHVFEKNLQLNRNMNKRTPTKGLKPAMISIRHLALENVTLYHLYINIESDSELVYSEQVREIHNVQQQKQVQQQQPQKPLLPIQNLKKSPSMDDLFTEEEVNSASKQQVQQNQQQNPQFDGCDTAKLPSMIRPESGGNDSSLFLQNSQSFVLHDLDEHRNQVDEYQDDDDPGFDCYEVGEKDFPRVAKQLAEKFGFPQRAVLPSKKKEEVVSNPFENDEDSAVLLKELQDKSEKKKLKGYIHLPPTIKHPKSQDDFYPVEYDNVIYDCFNLRVIYDRERTGFEETKEFPIVINSIIAGRYQILQYLGSAAFSKAVQVLDIQTQQMVCMKIIENNKDYMDQSIDEIKLLRYINENGDCDQQNVLKLYDFFYYKEHLFLVTELLKDNLYEFYKYNRENEQVPYFTIGRLQKLTKQILKGLEYIHGLKLIHCDLKPENILMKSYSRCECKIIDFGSSCFIHDHLSSYVQSRSYRAPEVIIGCKYDYKIDIWSLGCILAELWTGYVLFQNDTVQGLLARVIGIIGAFPENMLKEGRLVNNFFTKEKLLYQDALEDQDPSQIPGNDTSDMTMKRRNKSGKIQILVPKRSNLKARQEDFFQFSKVKDR